MSQTSIQWTDATWNPVTGCTKVSPGCAHCYAEGVANRFFGKQYPPVLSEGCALKTRPRVFTDVQVHEERLDQPLRWKKPRKVFVNSMSDLFHEDVPDDFIARVFSVMAWAREHTFQILTKRPERMRALLSDAEFRAEVAECVDFWLHDDPEPLPRFRWDPNERRTDDARATQPDIEGADWPLPNVWLGVSVENQKYADERIPLLLQTPAAVRFISAEPLLEGIDIGKHRPGALGLHLVIAGGESGPGARPSQVWWYRNLLGQCRDAGIAFFMKQLGANVIDRNDAGFEGDTPKSWPMDTRSEDFDVPCRAYQGEPIHVHLHDRKGGDMAEWPADLRVREFPL